ncbi:SHOCT domain-containing protein [Methylobacterium soli]|uniref:SHOCT domain-containing protein n=1 Tax=Methylobacterium soli TaxID=553447 RepID=A0A6L3SU83_9HYPH|nr:SHOCT domain-containing protein [Methylobacterium soli]KAB1077180.1 SHOCT domain-containing protein [Methylobacterium soli]GJE42185.1 hypothetical protein AEGHOMDF_1356 [Methylobacterium soli]
MDTDRLTKLAELHQQGHITEAEYETQKRQLLNARRLRPRWQRWGWKILAALFLLWLILPRGEAGFPTCDASTTRELVRQAIEQGPNARLMNMKLLSLDEVEQLSYDARTNERYCMAIATLNAGERGINWRLYQRGGNLFVKVNGL